MSDYESALQAWLPKLEAKVKDQAAQEPDDGDDIFGGGKPSPAHFEAIERVAGWTRQRFSLAPENVVTVAEVTCQLPGCPPLETVVTFWEAETRHHFKLLKPVAEVEAENIPYAWLKDTLVMPEGFGCDCC